MNCQRPEYQQFCAQIGESIPGCETVSNHNTPAALFSPDNPDETSLVLQSFELGKLFIEKRTIKFVSGGLCMYPCLRPHDVLHMESRDAEGIDIGDIAVFRRSNRLYGHRTISKGTDKGSNYIVTRPDTTEFGDEGPTFDKDILGVVLYIERKGKMVDTTKRDYKLINKIGLRILLTCFCLRQDLFSKLISMIAYIQGFQLYQKIAKIVLLEVDKKIDYSIQIPVNTKSVGRVYRKITSEELIENIHKEQNSILKCILSSDVNSKQAASLSFVFRPRDCPFSGWWLLETRTRIRYRGTGIEGILLEKAEQLLGLSGTAGIYASVYRDSHRERRFFGYLGFKEVDRHEDVCLKDNANQTDTRVIMYKELKR